MGFALRGEDCGYLRRARGLDGIAGAPVSTSFVQAGIARRRGISASRPASPRRVPRSCYVAAAASTRRRPDPSAHLRGAARVAAAPRRRRRPAGQLFRELALRRSKSCRREAFLWSAAQRWWKQRTVKQPAFVFAANPPPLHGLLLARRRGGRLQRHGSLFRDRSVTRGRVRRRTRRRAALIPRARCGPPKEDRAVWTGPPVHAREDVLRSAAGLMSGLSGEPLCGDRTEPPPLSRR